MLKNEELTVEADGIEFPAKRTKIRVGSAEISVESGTTGLVNPTDGTDERVYAAIDFLNADGRIAARRNADGAIDGFEVVLSGGENVMAFVAALLAAAENLADQIEDANEDE